MINNIDAEDHIADLRARVKNLTLTAVHHEDLRQSTTMAILAGVLPIIILALLAAGAATLWKICGPSVSTRARQWIERRRKNRGPTSTSRGSSGGTPLQHQRSWKKLAATTPSIYHLQRRLRGGKKKKSAGSPFRNSHPVLPLDEKELREHRDAILQQLMLGRQLFSELNRRHNSRQNLQEE